MPDMIKVERRADCVWVTINRPDARNALSRQTNVELLELADEIAQEPDLTPIVITGAGTQAFSAGADLKERRGISAEEATPYVSAISGAIEAWARIRRPTIAAMNGSAFGGGLELALACDLRVLVDGAELGLTEVRLGIMPGAGGTQRLPRLIGIGRAAEMILLGRRVSSAKALEYGLVNQVVPASGLRAAIDALIGELAGSAPLSLMLAKKAIYRGIDMPLEDGLQLERELYDVTATTEDRNEGIAAFVDKRPPKFTGR